MLVEDTRTPMFGPAFQVKKINPPNYDFTNKLLLVINQ